MRYIHAILLSLLLHFLIVSYVDTLPDQKKKDELPVEIVYPQSAKSRNLVRETETKDQKEPDKKEKARFLSEREKRFREEMRARNSGLTQNNGGGGRTAQKSEEIKNPEPGPGKVAKRFEPLPNPWAHVGSGKPGPQTAVGEKLPEDVKFGEFNALNTDRYLYYSFFARIEERIRPRWEMRVRDVLEQTGRQQRQKEWLTQIEILLDRTGKFQQVILHKKSGFESLDLAAIDAFKAGSPYQNPPQEMVQDDGHIHLYYSISVNEAF